MPTISIALHRALDKGSARAVGSARAALYGHAGMAGCRGEANLGARPDDNPDDNPAARSAANPAAPPAAPPVRGHGRRLRPAQLMKAP